jgi:hypothetical protein
MNMIKTMLVKLALTLTFCVATNCLSAQKGFTPIPTSWFSKVFTYAVFCKQQNVSKKTCMPIVSNEVIIIVIRCTEPKEDKKVVQ